MTRRQATTRQGTVRRRGAGREGIRRTGGTRLARSHAAGGGFGPADRHRGDPSGPVPDRVPDDPDDRLAVPAAGDRGLRPRAGGAGHPAGPSSPSRLAAAAGAGFALATLGGYLLSVWTGLFGFKEVRTTAGIAAGVMEVAAFVVLAALALAPAPATAAADRAAAAPARFPARIPPAIARAAATTAAAPGGGRAGAARGGRSRGQSSRASRHGHGHGPEDHDDRRGDGTDQRQGLHPLLVRPGHPGHVEMLRQLRRVLAPGDRHRRGQHRACPAGSARSPEPAAPASSPTTGTRCTPTSATPPPARPGATTSTSTAASGTRCVSPGRGEGK